jgi:hypothetical protein
LRRALKDARKLRDAKDAAVHASIYSGVASAPRRERS